MALIKEGKRPAHQHQQIKEGGRPAHQHQQIKEGGRPRPPASAEEPTDWYDQSLRHPDPPT